jgi:glucose-1-phosphate thymidylyltransferase
MCGIREILVVTGAGHVGDIVNYLGSGAEYGVNFTYKVQDEASGVAHAVSLAEHFAQGDKLMVVLGDNIMCDNLKKEVEKFEKRERGAHIFLKRVKGDVTRYGVAEVKGNKVVRIEEKPKHPQSNYVATGTYLYDSNVFDIIRALKPSARGEYEITDVNNAYVKKGLMTFSIIKGPWTDAGTFETYSRANRLAHENKLGF